MIRINSTLQMQENTNITTINNERKIEEDGNIGQVTSHNAQLIRREGKREGGKVHRTSAAQ